MMQMRSYERLIHNLTTVTGHSVKRSGVDRTKEGNVEKRGSDEGKHAQKRVY